MLESLVSSENLSLNSIDMSLLERLKWLQQQEQVVYQSNHNNSLQFHGNNNDELLLLQTTLNHFQMLGSNEFLPNYNNIGFGPTHEAIDGCISRTSSCHIEQVDTTMEVMLKNNEENKGITTLKKKRKSEVKEKNDKKIKVEAETEQRLKGKSNMSKTDQESSETTKDGLENQKLDYIHVRARRGQATDRHSLAERARREKISKKMKYLQDLVPGCNKITGKAGMLDEIINYVQSLQRQVEFLSMKISLLNPEIELGIEENSLKQFQAYSVVSSKPSIMVNTPLFPLDQQGSLDLSLINPNQTTSIEPPSSSWEKTQSQSLYNTSSLGFQF